MARVAVAIVVVAIVSSESLSIMTLVSSTGTRNPCLQNLSMSMPCIEWRCLTGAEFINAYFRYYLIRTFFQALS